MQYNASQSVGQNFANLLNLKALVPNLKGAHLSLGTPTVVTPNAGNGNKNTSLVIAPAAGQGFQSRNTTVFYNRILMANSYPGLPNKVAMPSPSNHTAVVNKIQEVHNLETSGLTVLWPPYVPRPGQEMTYRFTALAGHPQYLPGTRDIDVKNTGKLMTLPEELKLYFSHPFNGNPLTDFRDHVSNVPVTNSGTVSYFTDNPTLSKTIRLPNNGYLRIPKVLTPNILSGDFTIEYWLTPRATNRIGGMILSQWKDGTGQRGFAVMINQSSFQFWFAPASTASAILIQNSVFSSGTYVHMAIVRQGNDFRLYTNGNLINTVTYSNENADGVPLDWMIGHALNANGEPVGTGAGSPFVPNYPQIDIRELAVWNNAKYTANFVPVPLI